MTGKELPWDLENETSAVIYPKGQRPVLELPHNFSFVLNISQLEVPSSDLELTLAPDHKLRKATAAEVVAIKDILTGYKSTSGWDEWQGGETVTNKNKSTSRVPLPEDQWRYFVIAFPGSNKTVAGIERALTISPLELKIGFTLMQDILPGKKAPMVMSNAGRLFSQLQSIENDKLAFFNINEAFANDIRLLHTQLNECDHKLINLPRFAQALLDLDALPSKSPLLFLGYFALLESLLTHQPKPADTIDSITRQVKRKISLLDNRWQPRIEYTPLPENSPEKIWSVMYSYRSCLAHGGEPDFKKELQPLVNGDCALKLLKQTVKSVLRQALTEPQLIVDLRDC